MYTLLIIIITLLVLWTGGSLYAIKGIEGPRFVILREENGYQIRQYDPYLVAETKVEGTYEEAMRNGFRIIANYIFGNNTGSTSIAMTVPVREVKGGGESIAMTTPVRSETSGISHMISFVMPRKYTLETLPKPNNKAVTIREVPAQKVAVLSFSWYASARRVQAKKMELAGLLERDQVKTESPLQVARYNPPFTIPFLLRNEIQAVVN